MWWSKGGTTRWEGEGALSEVENSNEAVKVLGMGGHPRREGGAKPPKKATETESKRGGSGATVQRTKSCDMIITNLQRSIV